MDILIRYARNSYTIGGKSTYRILKDVIRPDFLCEDKETIFISILQYKFQDNRSHIYIFEEKYDLLQ